MSDIVVPLLVFCDLWAFPTQGCQLGIFCTLG